MENGEKSFRCIEKINSLSFLSDYPDRRIRMEELRTLGWLVGSTYAHLNEYSKFSIGLHR